MIICNSKYGQLSNRLILIAHCMATAFEKNEKIWLTTFDDIKANYSCCDRKNLVLIKGSIFWELEQKIQRSIRHDLHIGVYKVVTNWNYRDSTNVEKYREDICAFFTPKEDLISKAKEFFSTGPKLHKGCLVGVHIRRGDYQQWRDGKYYYADTVYNRIMHELEDAAIQNGLNLGFILFSNEELDLNNFTVGAPCYLSKGNPQEDHWIMSNCDYLVGPPSTFTRWAAYMGKTKLAYIESEDCHIDFDAFKYISI